MFFTGVLISP